MNKYLDDDIENKSYKDEILVIITLISVFVILVLLDAFNWVYAFATAHQDYYIDKIVMLYFPLSLMSIWGASLQFRRKKHQSNKKMGGSYGKRRKGSGKFL